MLQEKEIERIGSNETIKIDVRLIAATNQNIEKLITKGKDGSLANRRLVIAKTGEMTAKKIFEKIAPKYAKTSGGYTRIVKMGARRGDAAKMAIIEFV